MLYSVLDCGNCAHMCCLGSEALKFQQCCLYMGGFRKLTGSTLRGPSAFSGK